MENSTTTIGSKVLSADYKDGDLMEPWAYSLAAMILLFIGFIGFTLNLFVIVLMCRNFTLWTPMNIILFNLVCSDLSVSIFGNPFTLTAALSHGWIFGRHLCISYGFFMALLGITSITTLTVLAYERYSLITYPLSSHQLTTRGAVISILFIWLYSFALTSPPLFGWGAYVNEAANISCSVNWESQTWNATSYIVFLFCFGLGVPVVVISYSYLNITLTLRQNSERLGRKSRAERRVTVMVSIMILAFLVAWTPYAVFALVSQFGSKDLISPAMGVMPALLAKSSICYNPFIYVGLNTQFRASFMKKKTNESTVIETTEQNEPYSQSSGIVDCTIKSIRQGKLLKKPKGSSPNPVGKHQELNCTNTNPSCSGITLKDTRVSPNFEKELTVFADGKIILNRTNGQKSNF